MTTTWGIFYNKNSGSGEATKKAELCQKRLAEKNSKVVLITGDSLDESQRHLANSLPDLDSLIVIGGDGTLNAAFSVIVKDDHPLPVGIIPAGTVNNFAKRYHIPQDTETAIANILAPARLRKVGLGKCGTDKAIVSSLTFGNLATLSNEVRQKDKQKFGLGVYLVKAIQQIGKNKSYLIKYQIGDHQVETLRTWFALITTSRLVGGFAYDTGAKGKMHVSVLHNIHFQQVGEYIYFAVTGKLRRAKNITAYTTQKLTVTPQDGKKVVSRIDGDEGPQLPLTITFLPEYLPLMVPQQSNKR
ncbi:diacylglycerol/lipid kinase family protein [Ligilactobacillus acidipiscis]|uniref:diacylglycerol/lipid kinase family protein n=1 Tax=Ligilactobacillus acidipiscis TaxID=89059 RepID=UPI0023F93F5C|nr:diacylglycerol kinase family protein [Ligilactobacillus acidipiscis]WEV56714.1 diacylglycerol kinase family protein [Ligilactobacillus acidipiscis]